MKKRLTVCILFVVISSALFAQTEDSAPIHKHKSGDIMLGLNLGMSVTPNIFITYPRLIQHMNDPTRDSLNKVPDIIKGNYAFTMDSGFTFDYYLFYWLSVNTGALVHPGAYIFLNRKITSELTVAEVMRTPLCLTIPFSFHVNIPQVEWLYVGAGVTCNIPLMGIIETAIPEYSADSKGEVFWGIPIDIGFDFASPGKGGGRFIFRLTPEFHQQEVVFPLGFVWQIYNWKIYGKQR